MSTRQEIADSIWTEKFRPKDINDMIIPDELKKFFKEKVISGIIPNITLIGATPGGGKTSLAHAIVREMDADYIYINMSEAGGVDTFRTTIKSFATSMSLTGKPKVVICDEFDGVSLDGQRLFRGYVEAYFKTCRFILTGNYITNIIEPLREGRFQLFDFNFSSEEYVKEMKPKIVKRLCSILKFENVEFEIEAITTLVNKCYPNIRKMISTLQKFKEIKGVINSNVMNFVQVDEALYELILNRKFTDARSLIIKNAYDHDTVYRGFYDYLVPMLDKTKQAKAIIIIAEYMYKSNTAIDKEIQLAACLLELIGCL